MADIPDGIDAHTARMAIAWVIAQKGCARWAEMMGVKDRKPEEIIDAYTELYRKAFKQLVEAPPKS